jgi:uncharacterized protein (DUF983 family)
MAVLKGYSHIQMACEECGDNYIAIESTDDPNIVRLRCWCASTCLVPRGHPPIKRALGDQT